MSGSRIMYQADANLDIDIAHGLRRRQPDIDFQTADDANLRAIPNPEVLAIAARQGRILVSHDRRTMPTHFSQRLMSGEHSAGVILLPQEGSIRKAIELLLLVWRASSPEEWIDHIEHFP